VLARLAKLEKDLAARPTPAAAASDPQVLARLDKLEKDLAARPAASPNPAAAALVQQESRLQRLESGLQDTREGLNHARAPQGAPQGDPQVLERLARLEKALAQRPVSQTPDQPEAAPAKTAAPKVESRPSAKQASRAENDARKVSHKVRPGETLGGLARRYRVNENDIVRWNQMGTRRLLLKGETITVFPGQSS
jgi:membrane-bound lytic murein transglycosylase D